MAPMESAIGQETIMGKGHIYLLHKYLPLAFALGNVVTPRQLPMHESHKLFYAIVPIVFSYFLLFYAIVPTLFSNFLLFC